MKLQKTQRSPVRRTRHRRSSKAPVLPRIPPLILQLFLAVCVSAAVFGCSGPADNSTGGTGSGAIEPQPGASAGRVSASDGAEGRSGESHHYRGKTFTFDLPMEMLKPQEDAILTRLDGTVGEGMLGHVHSLAEDEDLHFSLDDPEMESPVVCELMNALSIPPDAGSEYWSSRFGSLFSGGAPVRVWGVFRVWPDHAAPHAEEDSDKGSSNPPHVVEIHPVASVESGRNRFVTLDNIAPITYEGQQYAYKDPGRWGDMLSHDVDTTIERKGEREYLRLTTPQIGFNYWELHVQVVDPVVAVKNGHRFTVHVLTPTRAYTETVRCFTVAGTRADSAVTGLSSGSEATLAAIGRFDLRKLLENGGYHGPVPIELCVFGINPPKLPSARRGERSDTPANGAYEAAAGIAAAAPPGNSGRERRYAAESGAAAAEGGRYSSSGGSAGRYSGVAEFIGNRRSHVYHPADSRNLPAPQNRVYFNSEEEAQAAGFRRAAR